MYLPSAGNHLCVLAQPAPLVRRGTGGRLLVVGVRVALVGEGRVSRTVANVSE
jgi:hypothetical protein